MNKKIVLLRRLFLRDTIIMIMIVLSPFIFFLYNIAPKNTQVWTTDFFNISLSRENDIDFWLWIISYKLLLITILSIWFISCKHWWRITILIPFSIELFKLISAINDEVKFLSEFNFLHILPILIPCILLLLFLSKKLNFYSKRKSLNNELNDEINLLMQNLSRFKSENYKDFKRQLLQLRQEKHTLEKKEYLYKLIKLREDFSRQ